MKYPSTGHPACERWDRAWKGSPASLCPTATGLQLPRLERPPPGTRFGPLNTSFVLMASAQTRLSWRLFVEVLSVPRGLAVCGVGRGGSVVGVWAGGDLPLLPKAQL